MSVLIDPVSTEDLARLRELSRARDNVAHKGLSLDLEKITILAAGKRIDEEHDLLLSKIMNERGIPLSATVDINPNTGEIVVSTPAGEKPPTQDASPKSG